MLAQVFTANISLHVCLFTRVRKIQSSCSVGPRTHLEREAWLELALPQLKGPKDHGNGVYRGTSKVSCVELMVGERLA